MPYIFVEELEEGQEAAEVRSEEEYNTLQATLDDVISARDELQEANETLTAERDNLTSQLTEAKTKFANAFLSGTQPKQEQQNIIEPKNFHSLFTYKKEDK